MPTINVETLVLNLQRKLALNPTDSDIMNLSVALKQLNTSTVNIVQEISELPFASAETLGLLYFVEQEGDLFQTAYLDQTYFWKTIGQNFKSGMWTVGYSSYGLGGSTGGNTCCFNQNLAATLPSKSVYSVCDVFGGNNWHHVIDFAGNAYGFGENGNGQLGVYDCCGFAFCARPMPFNWKKIAPAASSLAGITTNGQLRTWGRNYHQSLGLGCGNGTNVPTPTPVLGFSSFTVIDVAMANDQGGATVRDDGTMWTWGYNTSGQMGISCCPNLCFSSPVQVAGGGTTWCSVVQIHVGFNALKTDGTMWGWGANSFGQIGDGTSIAKSSPTSSVCAGSNWCKLAPTTGDTYTTAGLKTDGTLWTWGYVCYGLLGNGSCTGCNLFSPAQTATGGTNWCGISLSFRNAVGVKTDGTLWTWGCNDQGQLGIGCCSSICCNALTPTQVCPSGKTNWWRASAGYYGTIALDIYSGCSV